MSTQDHDIYCSISMKCLFWSPVGKFRPTMEIVLIFLECVRSEGVKDQLVIGGKMTGIMDSILPDNLSIQAEKIVRPRLCYCLLTFLMPSR